MFVGGAPRANVDLERSLQTEIAVIKAEPVQALVRRVLITPASVPADPFAPTPSDRILRTSIQFMGL